MGGANTFYNDNYNTELDAFANDTTSLSDPFNHGGGYGDPAMPFDQVSNEMMHDIIANNFSFDEEDVIIVIGQRISIPHITPEYLSTLGMSLSDFLGLNEWLENFGDELNGGGTHTGEEDEEEHDCGGVDMDKADRMQMDAPDNARYYAPEGFKMSEVDEAIGHLQSVKASARIAAFGAGLAANGGNLSAALAAADAAGHTAIYAEMYQMYTNSDHPYFIDIKDTPNGAGPFSYENDSGQVITNNTAYEAFGNWIYGYVGTQVGLSHTELNVVAGVTQEGTGAFDLAISGQFGEIYNAIKNGEGDSLYSDHESDRVQWEQGVADANDPDYQHPEITDQEECNE